MYIEQPYILMRICSDCTGNMRTDLYLDLLQNVIKYTLNRLTNVVYSNFKTKLKIINTNILIENYM